MTLNRGHRHRNREAPLYVSQNVKNTATNAMLPFNRTARSPSHRTVCSLLVRTLLARILLATLVLAFALAGNAEARRGKEITAISHVTVIPMTGVRLLPEQTVLLKGGRIEALGPSTEIDIPRKARIIDGTGHFLLPGFADLHVHVNRSRADAEQLLRLFLANGVTTLLNLDGGRATLELRQAIRDGQLLGPTIYTTGPILRGSDRMTKEQGADAASRHIEAGYDMIKVYNPLSKDAYDAILEEAVKANLPVIGHAVRSVGIEGALANGQHIAHMEEVVYGYFTWPQRDGRPTDLPDDVVARLDLLLDSSLVEALARRVKDSGVYVIPNLTAYHQIGAQVDDLERTLARPEVALMPQRMTDSWQRARNGYTNRENPERFRRALTRTFPFLQELTAAFQAAGVPLLAGTDVGIPVIVAGTSLHNELEELVAAGLTPEQAIATATTTAANFLGRTDIGSIEEGKRADLVLLRKNPLETISNTRTIEAVAVGGKWLDRKALDRLLAGSVVSPHP